MNKFDFGDSEEPKDDIFLGEIPRNKYLFKPYGTTNSRSWKEAGNIILSPSGITKFFNNPEDWYNDRYGIPTFAGNTNTVLGNAIHGSIDSYLNGDGIIPKNEIDWWITTQYSMNIHVDKTKILADYLGMMKIWLEYYKSDSKKPKLIEFEVEHVEHLDEDFSIATMGTMDAVFGDTLVDWKTCSQKPRGIGNYKYQLMQYARLLKLKEIDVSYIKIVYIQRPTKTLQPRMHIFEHKITPADWIEANYFAELQVNSLLAAAGYPELKTLIFRPNPTAMW